MQKVIFKKTFFPLLILSLTISCTPNFNTNQVNDGISTINNINKYSIKGKAEFPSNLQKSFTLKALFTQIAPYATVSLIYPSDHPTLANVTVATGLTDVNCNFIINPTSSFVPIIGNVYVLEASKRIGDSGNDSMTIRTYIKWNGTGWNSITTPDIYINSKTTALAVIQNNMKTQVSASDTIGKIDVSNGNSITLDIGSPVLISSTTVTDVSNLVTQVLFNNHDPIEYIKPINGQYKIVNPLGIELPSIPGNLNITNITETGFTLSWSSLPNCTYNLVVTRVSDNTEIFNQNVGSVSSYDVTGLDSVIYTWKVREKNTFTDLYGSFTSETAVNTSLNNVIVTTFAGGTSGYLDGTGTNAQFLYPHGIAVDSSGNFFVADTINSRIRKIDSSGVVTTLAGDGTFGYLDGTGTNAQFNYPIGVAVDSSGNVFVADESNHRIRKIDSSGVVTTFAGDGTSGYLDGTGTNAKFNCPSAVAVDSSGNVFVADSPNYRIRKIYSSGVVTTLAGDGTSGYLDGTGTNAKLGYINGIAVDSDGNLFVTDQTNRRIRKIDSSGVVTTLAGDGTSGYLNGIGTNAKFDGLSGIAVDSDGNLFVADMYNHRIRKIDSSRLVTTLAGGGYVFDEMMHELIGAYADGNGTNAKFYRPNGVAVDSDGNVFVADMYNNRIRKIE